MIKFIICVLITMATLYLGWVLVNLPKPEFVLVMVWMAITTLVGVVTQDSWNEIGQSQDEEGIL